MTLDGLIHTYGYLALLIGAFLEGETVVVMAGFAAHRGWLTLPGVMLATFAGSLAGDQLWFIVGRRKGRPFVDARPRWRQRAERVQAMLARWQLPVVLGFRFVYGFRNITPFVIGASGFSPLRFLLLNALGAAIWAVVISGAGYLFGEAMERLLADARRYEAWLIVLLACAGAAAWGFHLWRARRKAASEDARK